jgi:hypothetical protein
MARSVGERNAWRVNGWWAYWLLTTLSCAACATGVDGILLQKKLNYFSGGFLARDYLANWPARLGFIASSFLVDFAVLSVVVTGALWLALMARLRPRLALLVASVACLVPLAVVEFANYRLGEYLGDSFDLRLMFELSGRNLSEFLAVSPTGIASDVLWVGVAGAVLAGWIGWTVTKELSRHIWARTIGFVNPHAFRAVIASFSLLAVAATTIVVMRGASDAMDNGLKRKPTVMALSQVISVVSDVDGDGYGILGRIVDTAPFDARIHPYALEIPGNGIDEDGLGGDLPLDFPVHVEAMGSPEPWKNKPNIVFVLLESVRDDMVGSTLEGRPVTPVLDGLANAGARAAAYSHNGFTVQSRRHLFSGSLAGRLGGTTLVDDFKSQGYEVAYFSGQDESFGGTEGDTGFSRADVAFDARSDRDRRYSASTTPGSLAVPLEVVLERVEQFFASRRSNRPLFLYVNLHDTHYPYYHRTIEQILPSPVLRQSELEPARADDLRRMYANTLANVDRAIGRLLLKVTQALGAAPGVIVTSDHGESLFEEGFLGHGYLLDESQTRIPLIVSGLPMLIEQPWGQSSLRHELLDALAGSGEEFGAQPTVRWRPQGEVFQYLGTSDLPAVIGLRSKEGLIQYDFRSRHVQETGEPWVPSDKLSPHRNEHFLRLIRTWESLMLARVRDTAPVSGPQVKSPGS